MENRKAGNDPSLMILENLPDDPSLAIPLLRELASLPVWTGNPANGLIKQRLERRYTRLCRIQGDLGRLDFTRAKAGSFDDFVFSQTDFLKYQKIDEEDFLFYSEAPEDYDDDFFAKNFKIDRKTAKQMIIKCYAANDKTFTLNKANPVILAVMRTLETSLEMLPLFAETEILKELKTLYGYLEAGPFPAGSAAGFFRFLVQRLDKCSIIHKDGMETKLSVSPEGALKGTFRPGGKPWTLVLIPA
ncbi:hypothetical protein [Leadbettera azotonutricia]|uniref:Uncharacterized protein n=1 Tax=Leadbettera azotonutricia (strain ATCC BAA-888 / DSM 13862 / ZAS-9) TaxID=545695 RepID=F5YBB7_LEAAZ|nr:hypothetical protein [Leadbettera azotonutricia]AEF82220.1 hypothetical protein TREAZ_1893 [Leadbettera azotonutricia ZAS-9]